MNDTLIAALLGTAGGGFLTYLGNWILSMKKAGFENRQTELDKAFEKYDELLEHADKRIESLEAENREKRDDHDLCERRMRHMETQLALKGITIPPFDPTAGSGPHRVPDNFRPLSPHNDEEGDV